MQILTKVYCFSDKMFPLGSGERLEREIREDKFSVSLSVQMRRTQVTKVKASN